MIIFTLDTGNLLRLTILDYASILDKGLHNSSISANISSVSHILMVLFLALQALPLGLMGTEFQSLLFYLRTLKVNFFKSQRCMDTREYLRGRRMKSS